MKQLRSVVAVALLAGCAAAAWSQQPSKHLLTRDELKKTVPAEFFYDGQKAPTQLRNAAGFESADGKMALAALVDASGYSTAVQQRYQGMLITESKLDIGGSQLPPGEYGFGFSADGKFVVMNVADQEVLSAPFSTDSNLQRPVPLKIVEDGSAYKLYGGKKWVEIKPD